MRFGDSIYKEHVGKRGVEEEWKECGVHNA
jgi:hypothetical protein